MKYSVLRRISVFFFFLCGMISAQALEIDTTYNIGVQQDSIVCEPNVCYEVFGMDCPGCESALEKQLNKLDGVEKVKASWEKQQVLIWTNDKVVPTDEEITKRIKKANFTPGEKIQSKNDDEE
ncbi:heavy-metal-associated domain-containing protein [Sunxiuqinia sp. A32]|uniref:heavy-metal-associated domain-containing protein n=1 Tax=Sunxiuqinia sp. A32 TaxID=3461496 RepID=UPI004045A3E8